MTPHAERDEPALTMWTIYQNPLDYPGKFVVRGADIYRGLTEPVMHAECAVFDTLEAARSALPEGLFPIVRAADDPAPVVETWL